MKSRIARLEKQQSVADRFRRPLDLQAKRVKAELKETAQVIVWLRWNESFHNDKDDSGDESSAKPSTTFV